MHRRPDVIEELNLHHRLQTAHRHPDRTAGNIRLSQRRVEATFAAELGLQSSRQFENSTLAFHLALAERLVARRIGHIFAKHHNTFIPAHLIFETAVNQVRHRPFCRIDSGCRLSIKPGIHRSQLFGVHMLGNRLYCRQRRHHRTIGRPLHLFVDRLLEPVDRIGIENPLTQQPHLHSRDRIPCRIGLQLLFRPIQPFIIT